MTDFNYDLITVGRVSMDLFAENIGAPFVDITGFETGVGGSPVNIAIGSSRLGLKSIAFTAVGDDQVGRFVKHYLQNEGVNTDFISTKSDARTGMAVVGVQPPDKFPLVFYRENPADIHLTLDEALALPLSNTKAVSLSGTALSRGSARDVTLFIAEQARNYDTTTFIDLDLRPDQWSHPVAYGLNMRQLLPLCDVIIGTEEEFYGALMPDPEAIMAGRKVSEEQSETLLDSLVDFWAEYDQLTLIVKRGDKGVYVYDNETSNVFPVNGFTVEVLNTVGAGDAFASGLLYGWSQGWEWGKSARFANACGAIVVTRHGCARAMPYVNEVEKFIENNGGY